MTPTPNAQVIGYCRVSTTEQGDSGAGLDAQEAVIRAECAHRGWDLVALHREVASGKTTAKRPMLAEALEALESKDGPRALVISKLDRLSRSVIDSVQLLERANGKKWDLVIIDMNVDTSTAMGKAWFGMAAVFAQMYRDQISENTRAGLAAKRAQGVTLGRPRTMPAETIERLRALRAEGLSYRRMADALNDEGIKGSQGGRWFDVSVMRALQRYGA